MTSNLMSLGLVGVGIYLIGVNVGIVVRFWPAPWLTSKLSAVTLLLAYVCTGALFGHPPTWRLALGYVAVMTDVVALCLLWYLLSRSERTDGILVAYVRRHGESEASLLNAYAHRNDENDT